jgi:transcriptional regulator with XRE-family HTH domain
MNDRISVYNAWHYSLLWTKSVMPKIKDQLNANEPFGERMARLRNESGYSQRDLAKETGISQRMIAYYEKQAKYPPTHVLPTLAKTLGLSLDQLMGLEKVKKNGKAQDTRLWRRFSKVEKLPPVKRKQIVQILDTFLESEKARKSG